MNRRPIEPHGLGAVPLAPFVVLAAAWGVIAAAWLAWAAGRLVAAVLHRPTGPGFGARFVAALIRADWHTLWPSLSPAVVGLVYAVLLGAALGIPGLAWLRWKARRPHGDDPLPSLARPQETDGLALRATAVKARRLRPSLAEIPIQQVPSDQAGIVLGIHRTRGRRRGPTLFAGFEDVLLAIMAPRTGKTTALTAPATIAAPGPVIATSNKPDLWATTAARRAIAGRVWVFDPQAITHEPQSWWWNPLAAAGTWKDAYRLADHFVQQIRQSHHIGGDDFWVAAAQDLLTCLILAATCAEGTLVDVQRWLSDVMTREPGRILANHGFAAAARSLTGRQAGAPETRDGVYETARTAASCLADPQIMAWVTPGSWYAPTLDVNAVPGSADTVYLLSKDGAGSAAPLVAGLTDQLLRAGVRAAETRGGRLDPPMLAVLDEAANICRISDLPDLYSHLGSHGIIPLTILQSYPQGTRVWGEQGMATLWSSATIKLIGAGIDDAKLTEDLSRLIGEHDVPVRSISTDGSWHHNWQVNLRRQRILDPAQIRSLPRGSALLLATGIRPAMIDLLPWYEGPDAAVLNADVDQAIRRITANAGRAHLGG